MTHHSHYRFPLLFAIPKNSPAIKVLSLLLGLLVFFFSPEVVHAEFLDRLELINHLRQGHYQKLEQILARQERLYQAKKIPEEHVEAAYFAFANSAADLEEKLNEWVTRNDKNGTALLARGIYYWNIGWLARGGDYISKTHTQRVSTMKDFFTFAWQNLKSATKYKSTSGVPYRFLISMAMNFSDTEGMSHLLQQGLEADRHSVAVRWGFLHTLTPWWSGLSQEASLQAVHQFLAEHVTPFVKDNIELKALLGYPDYLRAEILERNNQEEEALSYYHRALQQGSLYWITYQYAKVLSDLGRHEEALEMITQALAQRPQVSDLLDEKARILAYLKHSELALQAQADALQYTELDPDLLQNYAWRLRRQQRTDEAEALLIRALTYGSHDHSVVMELGTLYLQDKHNPAQAMPYLKQAVELRPQKSWNWLLYASSLYGIHNCQAVDAFQHYKTTCLVSGSCDPENVEWGQKTSQRMIWKEGCWREHPTVKLLGRIVTWLPRL